MELTEWNTKSSFTVATKEVQNRLDQGSKALVAWDFWHTVQSSKESVSEFIRRLEQVFQRAYGKEQISIEVRDTLLHGQLQEDLSDVLIKAVSGALTYQQLCMVTKNDKRRQKDLCRRHQYRKDENATPLSGITTHKNVGRRSQADQRSRSTSSDPPIKCNATLATPEEK